MKIVIVMPEGADLRSGNRHTAHRWAGLLRELDHRVVVRTRWAGERTDVLIALHARKSFDSIEAFHRQCPDKPLILALTGTDLYRDIVISADAKRALDLASRLIVLQEAGLQRLSRRHRAKAHVVYQSADTLRKHHPTLNCFRVTVVGHLREEKDPFRAVEALALLPPDLNVEVVHLGAALSPDMEQQARLWMKREARYHWLGSKTHGETLRIMSRSHLLVVSSVMEGGANVICEAARIGVPVLASRVSGNVGMLGKQYAGYFRLRDQRALARLIRQAAKDSNYYGQLKREILTRRPRFAPASERRALSRILRGALAR